MVQVDIYLSCYFGGGRSESAFGWWQLLTRPSISKLFKFNLIHLKSILSYFTV
jgi:hypothetical protein